MAAAANRSNPADRPRKDGSIAPMIAIRASCNPINEAVLLKDKVIPLDRKIKLNSIWQCQIRLAKQTINTVTSKMLERHENCDNLVTASVTPLIMYKKGTII